MGDRKRSPSVWRHTYISKLELGLYEVFTHAAMAAAPTALTRHVHVAETDQQARDEAAEHLATPRMADPVFSTAAQQQLAQAGLKPGADGRYAGEAGSPERLEWRRVFQERAKSYEFWIDNGLALVGNPDTVIRKIEEQHALIGHDVLCTQHGFGQLAPELVKKSIQLFGEKVIPALA